MTSVEDGCGTLVAGVDLGGTKIQTVVARGDDVLGQAREATPSDDAVTVADAVVHSVRAALEAAGADLRQVSAVGIGAPGRIRDGVISHSPNMAGMQEPFPMGTRVSQGLDGVTVRIDNDVTVATLGEMHRGAGRPFSSFLSISVGTGVGGGMVFDRTVWRGRGTAGEIGHMVVKPQGRRCGCGGRGHLEAYAGRASMQQKAERLVAAGERTVLFDLMAKHGRGRMTSGVIERALAHGDAMAERVISRAVWALGLALSSSQSLLDVEAMIIGGGLAERFGQPFIDRIAAEMGTTLFHADDPPVMLPAALGDLSGAIGAAVLAGA
jgi:glucokinase